MTHAEPVNVTVDVQKSYSINGHTEIRSHVLGITAYAGAPLPATLQGQELLRRINVPLLGFAGNINWCAPATKPADGIAGIKRWYASDEAKQMITGRTLMGDRYMMGRILPACRQLGIEPMIYLRGGPDWAMGPENIPRDAEEYAQLAVEYVRLLRQYDPQLRIIHYDNEPNAHYFKVNQGGADYAKRFVVIARALKKEFPDIRIGGPVILWPPSWPPAQKDKENWYTWKEWMEPFLDIAGNDLDFFDFHHYDMQSREDRSEYLAAATEEIQLTSNELYRRFGKRIPIYISEWGFAMQEAEWKDTAAHWKRRALPDARFLLDRLDEPDKVENAQAHDLQAMVAVEQSFRILNLEDTEKQTPTYWIYWLLRHTRGTRLTANTSLPQSSGLRVLATRQTPAAKEIEPEASVVLFNDSDVEREAKLDFVGTPNWLKTPRWERLFLNNQTQQLVRDAGEGTTVVLPPRSLAVARVLVPRNVALNKGTSQQDFYGQKVLQEWKQVGEEVTIPVTIPAEALRGAASARARIGIQGSQPTDKISLLYGGKTYPLQTGTYFQELPLPTLPTAGENALRFRLDARGGDYRVRVSTATIVLESPAPK